MDFAAAPLQVLLSENAQPDQLETFLKQLTERFQALDIDEKDRFGALQILLPTLRAYVSAAAQQQPDRERCLSTYLTPLVNMSLSNDSMVAAESVHLLSDDVAYWMAHEPAFGRSRLMQLLGQLLYVMETELDFVDLQPIKCIESGVQNNAEWTELRSHLQQQVKPSLQPTRISTIQDEDTDDSASLVTFNTNSTANSSIRSAPGILDIECCLDVINRFVQELPDGKPSQEFSGWIDVIMAVSVAMLACTDVGIRRKVTSELILSLFTWEQQQQQQNQETSAEKKSHWCRMLWERTVAIYKLPATNLLRSETYGLIAKFFDLYFSSNNGEPALDLRFDDEFFKILQSGLRSNDGLYRKYSSYILKRTIDYTTQHPESHGKKWTKYFEWSADQSQVYADQWADWFLLYDIMHETVFHLVDPVLPRFEALLVSETAPLDASWWICLFYRGFQNDTFSVKKGILEYIFGLENTKCLNILGSEREFIFGALLKTIDVTALYTVPTQGTLVSPFGEKLKAFTSHLVQAFKDEEHKAQFLRELIHHLAHVISSYVPIYYIMEALAETEPCPVWGSDELKSVRFLVDKHRNFHGEKARLYLRKLAIPATANLLDPSKLSFSDVAKTISSLTTNFPLEATSDAYKCLQSLIKRIAQENTVLADSLKCLKERTDTYVNDASAEEYASANSLCNQAFVIARSSVFVVSSVDRKEPDQAKARLLFESLIQKIKNPTANSTATLNRSLVLLNALGETFKLCFPENTDIIAILGLNDLDKLLEVITRQYLDTQAETDEDMVELLLATTRLLLDSSSLQNETRNSLLQAYYEKAVEALQGESKAHPCKVSITQIPCIQLIKIVYELALKHAYYKLPCDTSIATLVSGLIIKKTTEGSRSTRKWGDIVSFFIRCKWECMHNLANYASTMIANDLKVEIFSASDVFAEAVDQLENATDMCAEAIIDCVADVIALPGDKEEELVNAAVDHVIELIKENLNQSKTSPGIMRAAIRMIFQPELLSKPSLNQDSDGPLKRALQYLLQIGEIKAFIVAQCATQLHEFWSRHTDVSDQSMLLYANEISELLIYGPLRDRDDQKLDAAITLRLQSAQTIEEAQDSAAIVFSQNDYLVRVLMNDLMMRLDESRPAHVKLARQVLDRLLAQNLEDKYYFSQYLNTIEHRERLRIWCAVMLLIRFISEENVDHYLDLIHQAMRRETVVSVRCYVEWAMMKILAVFPSRLQMIYKLLENPDAKPHFIVSMLTILFPLGDILDDTAARDYFDEIFPRIVPWLTSNHFTVRLYAYCAWFRNLASCKRRGLNPDFDKNRYMTSLISFVEQYAESIKFTEKIQSQYYLTKFDPIQDYNIEFIFRQMMTIFGVIENEKISSRIFAKVNCEPAAAVPFVNTERELTYNLTGPTELFKENATTEQSQQQDQKDKDDDEEEGEKQMTSFQKKILPWQMMLETDVDLTKSLVQKKRRRNSLIVVASLIDRIPNLAGLCRTCEIFNAELLVVYSLKIKDDPGFTSISVSSERWMPMAEVGEPDVAAFLKEKKQEGYTLCGLEQTTTSATLGEYEFPEKCVLLLGKERAGVPADLLQMLDQTIEIPQQGITRSLNVHVSGAIAIYEYSKQMQWRSI